MADLADMAGEIEGEHLAAGLRAARAPVPMGQSGHCDECEWWMPRLVDGRCGFCRDGRKRPDDWEPPVPPADERGAFPRHHEEPKMADSSKINITGDALVAVRGRADQYDISLAQAANDLVVLGSRPDAAIVEFPTPVALADVHLDALLDEVRRRFAAPDLALGEAVARAEAAEAAAAEAVAWRTRVETALAA